MSENKNSQESPENSPASSPEKSSEKSPASSPKKGSENSPASSPKKGPKKCPDSSPKCKFEGLDMEVKSPSPSIQEKIAFFP